jgi:hypothetical protein
MLDLTSTMILNLCSISYMFTGVLSDCNFVSDHDYLRYMSSPYGSSSCDFSRLTTTTDSFRFRNESHVKKRRHTVFTSNHYDSSYAPPQGSLPVNENLTAAGDESVVFPPPNNSTNDKDYFVVEPLDVHCFKNGFIHRIKINALDDHHEADKPVRWTVSRGMPETIQRITEVREVSVVTATDVYMSVDKPGHKELCAHFGAVPNLTLSNELSLGNPSAFFKNEDTYTATALCYSSSLNARYHLAIVKSKQLLFKHGAQINAKLCYHIDTNYDWAIVWYVSTPFETSMYPATSPFVIGDCDALKHRSTFKTCSIE